jgi:class 3 adenylate cyclase
VRRRPAAAAAEPSRAPESYTPKCLAEKILTSKATLKGKRKQVTVLFADLKGLATATRMYREMGMWFWLEQPPRHFRRHWSP